MATHSSGDGNPPEQAMPASTDAGTMTATCTQGGMQTSRYPNYAIAGIRGHPPHHDTPPTVTKEDGATQTEDPVEAPFANPFDINIPVAIKKILDQKFEKVLADHEGSLRRARKAGWLIPISMDEEELRSLCTPLTWNPDDMEAFKHYVRKTLACCYEDIYMRMESFNEKRADSISCDSPPHGFFFTKYDEAARIKQRANHAVDVGPETTEASIQTETPAVAPVTNPDDILLLATIKKGYDLKLEQMLTDHEGGIQRAQGASMLIPIALDKDEPGMRGWTVDDRKDFLHYIRKTVSRCYQEIDMDMDHFNENRTDPDSPFHHDSPLQGYEEAYSSDSDDRGD